MCKPFAAPRWALAMSVAMLGPRRSPPLHWLTMTATDNPLLNFTDLPPFGAIAAHHVEPAVRQAIANARKDLQGIEALDEPDATTLLTRLEQLHDRLGRVWGAVEHLLSVADDPELRQAHDAVQSEVVEVSVEIAQSQPLFQAVVAVRARPDYADLSPAQRRALDQLWLDARLSGADLQGEQRKEFADLQQQLAELGTQYGHHVLDATKAWHLDLSTLHDVAGLPPSALDQASQSWQQAHPTEVSSSGAGPWRLTLDGPSLLPVLQHAKNRSLREQVYRAHVVRASSGEFDNTLIIKNILTVRRQQAQLLGYADYAALSLATKMAPSYGAVTALLERLRAVSYPAGQKDLQDLRDFAREQGAAEATDLQPWDVGFWAERLREKRYDYSDEALRPYFPLPKVLHGLFDLCARLFGIRVVAADGEAPVWHRDVQFFRIQNEAGQPLAAFYLDPYSRPQTKRGGAWMNECVGRSLALGQPGQPRLPVAYLICNGTPPVGDKPSLMTLDEVETLLHEFGHGLQHMLTNVDLGLVSGIRGIEWDAVELPSQFMENWCRHRQTLRGLSAHVDTGEPLPDLLFDRIAAARTFRAGSDMLRQLAFALTDLAIHHDFDPATQQAQAVYRQVAARTQALQPLAEDRFLCGFSHIFAGGYAAGYYSYKWAEVLSADAFAQFERVGLDDAPAVAAKGRQFAETILGLGGSVAPMQVFRAFVGRDPDEQALLRHAGLLNEVV